MVHEKIATHGVKDALCVKCVLLNCIASASITYWSVDYVKVGAEYIETRSPETDIVRERAVPPIRQH
jgi:hypothetical protein